MNLKIFVLTKTRLIIINPVITDKSNININNTAQNAVEFSGNKFWGGKKKADGLDFAPYKFNPNDPKYYFRIYSGNGKGQIFNVKSGGPGYARVAQVKSWGYHIMPNGKKLDFFSDHISAYEGVWNKVEDILKWGEPIVEKGNGAKYLLVDLSLSWADKVKTKVVDGKTVKVSDYSEVVYSMKELREDASLWKFNAKVDEKISLIADEFLKKTGMSKSIKLPVIFMSYTNDIEDVGAYSPDLANFKTVNKKNSVFPSQFFAPGNMVDLFEAFCKKAIPGALFADDFNGYHDGSGEVHCATAAKRKIFALKWWENVK